MAYENIATILNSGALLFTILTLVFTIKNKDFERGEMENTVNALLFGFFITVLIIGIKVIESLFAWQPATLETMTAQAGTYISYLTQIEVLALAPLLAVSCLVAMFLAKDMLERK